MTRILIRHGGEVEALRLGAELMTRLRSIEAPGIELRGPVPCAITRIAGRYRVQVEILADGPGASTRFIAAARDGGVFSGPLALGEGVAIDVDPTSLM